MKWLSLLPRVFYGFIGIVLVGIAILLMGYALSEVYNAMGIDSARATDELLNAIGIVVISTALIDVSKFIIEEEVPESIPSPKTNKEKPLRSRTEKSEVINQKVDEVPVNTDVKASDKFINSLLTAIDNNNLEGFDYLEYKQSLKSLDRRHLKQPSGLKGNRKVNSKFKVFVASSLKVPLEVLALNN